MKAVSNYVLALRKMRQPFQSKPAWKELLQSGWVQVESLQKNVTAESPNLCASFCGQPTLITASSY